MTATIPPAPPKYKAPFPYFGGKSKVAHLVWQALGHDVPNYVEPFFGSGAVLFSRPGGAGKYETVNDRCGFVANFWRAVKSDPEAVAVAADNPVNEFDLRATELALLARGERIARMVEAHRDWHDAEAAGWWVWGLCCWIGYGWCVGDGPWIAGPGGLVKKTDREKAGVKKKMPEIGHLKGVNRARPNLGDAGRGVNRHGAARTCRDRTEALIAYLRSLADRLRHVRVCGKDWQDILGPTPTTKHGLTAVFLDPPYSAEAGRDNAIYRIESATVAHDVRDWAIAHGNDPMFRIVLAGYEGEYQMPKSWRVIAWKAAGGYSNQTKKQDNRGRENRTKERLWLSPHCLPMDAAETAKPKSRQKEFSIA